VYAALDLGTNNCRLLIARPHDKSFRVLDGFTRIVRLGEGLSVTGRLSDAAMERTIDALRQCRNKLNEHQPARMRLIATEACRAASNGAEFIARVKTELGMDLEIVDRQTEASLAVTGCADLIEEESAGALMFDIGGGSSELAWLDFRGGRPRRQGRMAASIRSWQSLPVGVVSIAERFGGVEVTTESFEAMVAFVANHLREFKGRGKLKQMIAEHPVHLIGTSGTVTTLAGLHLGLERYERQKVDGLWMTRDNVDATMKALLAMSFDRRVAHPCIGRDRADLVLPGCAIFEAIRREWPTERVRVADRGLREGILISLIDEDRGTSRKQQMARR
jgi:exopolyphosphatase/guanosine-5'-triphosphate,3'-diphosphate pyrophosphatase